MTANINDLVKFHDPERTILEVTVAPDEVLTRLAKECLDVQDACNVSGMSKSFAAMIAELWRHPLNVVGGDWVAQHPIVKLWLDKFCDLARTERNTDTSAWTAVFDWKDGKTATFLIKPLSLGHWRDSLKA